MNTINQTYSNSSFISSILNATGKVFIIDSKVDTWGVNQVRALEVTVTTEIFGFSLSAQLCKALSHLNLDDITTIGNIIVDYAKLSVGGASLYQPMYPNFPSQVIDSSEEELLINAAVHYIGSWFGIRILPKYEKISRSVISKTLNPKVIDICNEKNLQTYVKNMVTANVSYSPAQCQDLISIAQFFQEKEQMDSLLVNIDIPNKENLAFWANLYLSNDWNFNEFMEHRFDTTTDVLRLIAAYSQADTSLAKTLRVAKLPRSIRKKFMGLLEKVCNAQQDKEQVIENLLSYRSEWVRIAHAIHIGEYSNKYKTSYKLLSKLRNNEKLSTFNSQVEEYYGAGNALALMSNLKKRPGVFARNLTRLLVTKKGNFEKFVPASKKNANRQAAYLKMLTLERSSNSLCSVQELSSLAQQLQNLNVQNQSTTTSEDFTVEYVDSLETVKSIESVESLELFNGLFSKENRNLFISSFKEIVNSVSTPVLLQAHSHFKNMETKMLLNERYFMPKGGISKMFFQNGETAKYDLDECKKIEYIIEKALIERFAELPSLGKVYVSPELKTQNIPFAMRSASKALKTVARGSSFNLENKDSNLRMFLWWKEPNDDRVDIDLSVSMYGDDFQSFGHCAYWNLRDKGLTHSGDITSAPNGACEFIDIDRSLIDTKVAYIVTTISAYTGQKYCDLPECFAGWMERDNLDDGEIFDARLVQNKIDLASATTNIIPIVYDVRKNRMIWIDTSYGNSAICSNALNNSDAIGMVLQSWLKTTKPNLYDLFEMHAKARGTMVNKKEEANQVFSVHEGVTPYDFDLIASEYMTDNVDKK